MKKKKTSKHHRKPTSIGGENEPHNISEVSPAKHEAWHTLFFNLSAQEIALIINATWLDSEWEFKCVKRKK